MWVNPCPLLDQYLGWNRGRGREGGGELVVVVVVCIVRAPMETRLRQGEGGRTRGISKKRGKASLAGSRRSIKGESYGFLNLSRLFYRECDVRVKGSQFLIKIRLCETKIL